MAGVVPTALQASGAVPWSTTALQVGGAVPWPTTALGRTLWTVGILAGLVVAWLVVQWVGDAAGERFDEGLVETAELAAGTLLVVLAAGTITLVWDAVDVLVQVGGDATGPDPGTVGVQIVVSLLAVAAAYGVVRVAGRVIRRAGDGDAVTDHRQEIAVHVSQVVAYAAAGFVILAVWQVNLGNLLVGAGFLGIVVGLAARQTLGVVIAGFVLLFSRPFEVGDWVIIDDQEGVVTDVTIHNTQLRTFEGEYVMIPNDKVTGTDIVNRSRRGRLRVSVDVGVDYGSDLAVAADTAREAMMGVDAVLDQPNPRVVAREFADSAVVLECRFWIDDPSARKMWATRDSVVAEVKAAFEREGIPIPFPQRVLSGREDAPVELAGQRRPAVEADGDGRGSDDPADDGERSDPDDPADDGEGPDPDDPADDAGGDDDSETAGTGAGSDAGDPTPGGGGDG